jgi:hypothetical protein
MSASNAHLFFCINSDCGNTAVAGHPCAECTAWSEACAEQAECSVALPQEGYECEVCKELTAPHYGMAGWMCDMCFKHTLVHKSRCDETRENCCCSGVLLYVAEHGPQMIMCDTCETEKPANGPGVKTCAACDRRAQYFADRAEEEIWCGTDEPLWECQVCGELTAPGDSETAGWICDECFEHAFDHHRNCNETRDMCCCYRVQCRVNELKPQGEAPKCTCDGSGLMCDFCAEEYAEPCRGCGVRCQLWVDEKHCRDCHRERYGVPENKPVHKSLQEMRNEIAEIEFRLQSNMTKGQKDDWIWILQNRRADLADAEKEMWAGYDQDDLNKLDRRC